MDKNNNEYKLFGYISQIINNENLFFFSLFMETRGECIYAAFFSRQFLSRRTNVIYHDVPTKNAYNYEDVNWLLVNISV